MLVASLHKLPYSGLPSNNGRLPSFIYLVNMTVSKQTSIIHKDLETNQFRWLKLVQLVEDKEKPYLCETSLDVIYIGYHPIINFKPSCIFSSFVFLQVALTYLLIVFQLKLWLNKHWSSIGFLNTATHINLCEEVKYKTSLI